MLQMCRRPLLMAARVGAQGVCSECFVGQLKQQTLLYNISRVPLLLLMIGSASQVGTAAFSPVQYIMCAPAAADDRQCKTGGKDMSPHLSWRQAFQQAEISTKLSGTSGHHSLLLGACFCSLQAHAITSYRHMSSAQLYSGNERMPGW
jgi:hypothetical protein